VSVFLIVNGFTCVSAWQVWSETQIVSVTKETTDDILLKSNRNDTNIEKDIWCWRWARERDNFWFLSQPVIKYLSILSISRVFLYRFGQRVTVCVTTFSIAGSWANQVRLSFSVFIITRVCVSVVYNIHRWGPGLAQHRRQREFYRIVIQSSNTNTNRRNKKKVK
jgi:hypothetical protein